MINFQEQNIKGLILDMDGVLWRDSESIGSLPKVFSKIDELGLLVVLATNNATKTVEQYIQKLLSFNVELKDQQILTTSMATASYLIDNFSPGSEVFVIGMDGLKKTITEAGFILSEENPKAVVVSVDRNISYEKIGTAMRFIRAGKSFIATNPDVTFPTPNGLLPGAGSIVSAVSTAAEKQPIYMGKPELPMMHQAINRMKLLPSEILVVGDRLDTDILAGQRAACKTALVLSGVTTIEQAHLWVPAPNYIATDLSELLGC